MPATARRYGLVVSGQRDDRLDLVSATQAAARYLRDLHERFGDWELVLAAYNAGEHAVQNAIQRAGSNSFTVLSQLRLLPLETRNYVPAVMSARGFFNQATTAADESNPAAVGAGNSYNFAKRNVFFAMNASSVPQFAADGDE
jgi:membrane-bound lytic murein transglycosylase D